MKAIDLFAGWGGFTLGAEQAGVDVIWAANHWPLAVRAHELNHPNVAHSCQDLRQADFTKLPSYDLLLASPACQGHSPASQPNRRRYHDEMRATAWAVIDCAEITAPQAIIIENVPMFETWTLYSIWCQALEHLGYKLQRHLVCASNVGVPQRRLRLILTATRNQKRIQFPMRKEPGFGPCIDWKHGKWRPTTMASTNTQARIAKARARGLGARFLSQHVTGHPGVPLTEPIRTITTKDQWIVVDGPNYRALTLREYARAMSFPDYYAWPADASRKETIQGLGNAIPPKVAYEAVSRVVEVM